jgi:Kef-type K+ transport system membrane component KefB
MGLGWVILPPSSHHLAQVLFIGTALSITAVPVAIKVLMDLGELETPAGKLIVSAAVIDDVLSLVLLAVMTALMGTGSLPAWGDLLLLVGKIILFFFLASLAGRYLFPRLGRLVRRTHAQEFEFSMLLIAAFSYALLARLLGMHFILGAFLAGLFFVRGTVDEKVYEDVLGKTSALTTGFLAPIFFASIGMNLDLTALWNIPGTLVLLILVAVIGKVIGAGGASLAVGFSPEQSLSIGAAMNARGTVELIVADIALQAGLFTFPDPPPPIVKHLFSAVVLMAVFTTLITPTTLAMILKKGKKSG